MKPFKLIRFSLVQLGLFCLGSFFLFFPMLGRTFASDDFEVLRRLVMQRDFRTPGFLRPLSDLTLYMNYLSGGLRPAGYYLFNILVHGINSFLVFLFCQRWTWTEDREKQGRYALLAALLFLVYPFHSEGIVWILGRGASMATLFGLAALVIFLGKSRTAARYWWTGLFYFTGMLAYEPVILLPLLCLIILYFRKEEPRARWHWGLLLGGILLLYLVIRIGVSGGATGAYENLFLKESFLKYAGNMCKVAGRLLLPPIENVKLFIVLIPVLVVVLSAALAGFYRRTRQLPQQRAYLGALLLLLAVCCVIPVLSSVSTRTSESDRLLYFPSVFLCCVLSFLLVVLSGRRRLPAAALVMLLYMLFFLEKNNWNWLGASDSTSNILTVAGKKRDKGKLFIVNLPDERDGAFIFRMGFPDALLLGGCDTSKVIVTNHLTREKELLLPDSLIEARTAGEIRLAPDITIRRYGGDSLEIQRTDLPAGGGDERSSWRAGKGDSVFFWNKKKLVQVLFP